MGNYQRNLLQKCTYWEKTGTNEYGAPQLSAPIILACRWEDIAEHVIDKRGNEVVSKSRIFVAQSLYPEGYLRLIPPGESEATSLAINALASDTSVEEIRQVKSIPNLRNPANILYTVWL